MYRWPTRPLMLTWMGPQANLDCLQAPPHHRWTQCSLLHTPSVSPTPTPPTGPSSESSSGPSPRPQLSTRPAWSPPPSRPPPSSGRATQVAPFPTSLSRPQPNLPGSQCNPDATIVPAFNLRVVPPISTLATLKQSPECSLGDNQKEVIVGLIDDDMGGGSKVGGNPSADRDIRPPGNEGLILNSKLVSNVAPISSTCPRSYAEPP